VLALVCLFGSAYGLGRVLGFSTAASTAIGILFWPAVALLFGLFGAALSGLERVSAPRRIRRILARIDGLDEREAEDAEYDGAFRDLRQAALTADPRGYLGRMRESILRGGKSRDRHLAFLAERKGTPCFRELLEDLARRWDDPVSWHARRVL
jgi:hypothetical protein